MADMLDKVIDTAKKLRKAAKKIEDPDVKDLICELTLSLADLKMQVAEEREEKRAHEPQEAPEAADAQKSAPNHEAHRAPVTTTGSTWPNQH